MGGFLTDFLSWRWVFWINIPIVVVGGTLACLLWRNTVRNVVRPKVDRIGLVLLPIGLTSLIFGWMEGPDYGWATPVIFGSLIIGVLGLGAFFTYESRHANPLIDIRLFRLRAFSASILVILLTQMSKICVAIFVPHFLQFDLHYTALWAGIGTVVAVFPFPFLSSPAGKLADKHGSRRPVLVSLAVLALANLLIGSTMLLQSYSIFALPLLLWGVALPFAMIPTGRLTANAVPAEKQGEVSGLVITARLVGGTLGVTTGSVLIAMNFSFSAIFWAIAVLLAVCTAYCLYALENDDPQSYSGTS